MAVRITVNSSKTTFFLDGLVGRIFYRDTIFHSLFVAEGVRFGIVWIQFLLFAYDVVLLAKGKLSIYRSIYVPTVTYGHEFWVVNERMRLRIQAAEISFLCKVAGREAQP